MKTNYDRHAATSRAQAEQKLQNCALLCAYVYGYAPGWYAICDGHIDGFRADYAFLHSHIGNFELHPIRAFFVDGNESYIEELDAIRAAVKEAQCMDELPPVATLTAEEKEAARLAVREALEEANPDDAEAWLEGLCGKISDLIGTDWAAVIEEVRK